MNQAILEQNGIKDTVILNSIFDKVILNSIFDKVISKTERQLNTPKPVVVEKPVSVQPLTKLPNTPAVKKHRYDGVPVEKVAKDMRAILKHFKYGMKPDEKKAFAALIAAQSHCASGTAAQIAKVLGSK